MYKLRIYYEDTDAGGIVYHSNYLNFFERARSELFFEKGLNPFEGDEHFLVRKINIHFKYPAKLGDTIRIETILINLKKASCTLEQIAYLGDKVLAVADVNLAFTKSLKPDRISEKFIKALNAIQSN